MKKINWHIKFNGRNTPARSIVNEILQNRGISADNANSFLNPSEYWMHPGDALRNIHHAAGMVIHSRCPLIYADTDTDGCSAAAIMIRWFKEYLDVFFPDIPYLDPLYYINRGKDHGIQDYFELPFGYPIDTVIIVDSINDDPKYYLELLDKGLNVIVLDHHVVPEAIKQINHPQFALVSSAWDYPNPALSGSGVVWKFCRYLDHLLGCDIAEQFADLATCGIIADICSVGSDSMENRAICNKGFNTPINSAILHICGKNEFNSTIISLGLAPLINAANRMDNNGLALKLFLVDDKHEIEDILKELENLKKQQKAIVESLLPALLKSGEKQTTLCKYFFIEGNNTLSGLLATKLCEFFGKPCLVLHDCGDSYKGSMRAKGVEDFSAILNESGYAECRGHENSAGVIIPKDMFSSLCDYIDKQLASCTFIDGYQIDVELDRSQITPFLMSEFKNIDRISGANFKPIKVCIDNVRNYNLKELSKGQHLSVETSDMKFLAWNFKDWDKADRNACFSAIGSLSENKFMGRTSNQLIIEDFNFSRQEDLWGSHTPSLRITSF